MESPEESSSKMIKHNHLGPTRQQRRQECNDFYQHPQKEQQPPQEQEPAPTILPDPATAQIYLPANPPAKVEAAEPMDERTMSGYDQSYDLSAECDDIDPKTKQDRKRISKALCFNLDDIPDGPIIHTGTLQLIRRNHFFKTSTCTPRRVILCRPRSARSHHTILFHMFPETTPSSNLSLQAHPHIISALGHLSHAAIRHTTLLILMPPRSSNEDVNVKPTYIDLMSITTLKDEVQLDEVCMFGLVLDDGSKPSQNSTTGVTSKGLGKCVKFRGSSSVDYLEWTAVIRDAMGLPPQSWQSNFYKHIRHPRDPRLTELDQEKRRDLNTRSSEPNLRRQKSKRVMSRIFGGNEATPVVNHTQSPLSSNMLHESPARPVPETAPPTDLADVPETRDAKSTRSNSVMVGKDLAAKDRPSKYRLFRHSRYVTPPPSSASTDQLSSSEGKSPRPRPMTWQPGHNFTPLSDLIPQPSPEPPIDTVNPHTSPTEESQLQQDLTRKRSLRRQRSRGSMTLLTVVEGADPHQRVDVVPTRVDEPAQLTAAEKGKLPIIAPPRTSSTFSPSDLSFDTSPSTLPSRRANSSDSGMGASITPSPPLARNKNHRHTLDFTSYPASSLLAPSSAPTTLQRTRKFAHHRQSLDLPPRPSLDYEFIPERTTTTNSLHSPPYHTSKLSPSVQLAQARARLAPTVPNTTPDAANTPLISLADPRGPRLWSFGQRKWVALHERIMGF